MHNPLSPCRRNSDEDDQSVQDELVLVRTQLRCIVPFASIVYSVQAVISLQEYIGVQACSRLHCAKVQWRHDDVQSLQGGLVLVRTRLRCHASTLPITYIVIEYTRAEVRGL